MRLAARLRGQIAQALRIFPTPEADDAKCNHEARMLVSMDHLKGGLHLSGKEDAPSARRSIQAGGGPCGQDVRGWAELPLAIASVQPLWSSAVLTPTPS